MVRTCKNVAPYSPTSLNVGTIVNVPLCNSLYLFLSFYSVHPTILYKILLFLLFLVFHFLYSV